MIPAWVRKVNGTSAFRVCAEALPTAATRVATANIQVLVKRLIVSPSSLRIVCRVPEYGPDRCSPDARRTRSHKVFEIRWEIHAGRLKNEPHGSTETRLFTATECSP